MPNYDYECTHCGHTFELFQSMTAAPLNKCPKCGKRPKRLIGKGSGLIFKGSGFYATDYKKTPSKEEAPKPPANCPAAKSGECPGCPPSN